MLSAKVLKRGLEDVRYSRKDLEELRKEKEKKREKLKERFSKK